MKEGQSDHLSTGKSTAICPVGRSTSMEPQQGERSSKNGQTPHPRARTRVLNELEIFRRNQGLGR